MIGKFASQIANLFKYHKKKIVLFFLMISAFVYLTFPFNDLSDLVTAKVSEATANQVYVSFGKLDLSIFPAPGLALGDVFLELPMFPPLKAKSLSASPSVLGLLTFKPGVTVHAEDLLGADVSLSTRGGEKNANGNRKQKVNLEFESLKLSELFNLLDLPVKIAGLASGLMNSTVDVDLAEQPTSQIQLNLQKVQIEETDINIQGFPLSIPRVQIGGADLDAKLEKGSLEISKLSIGKQGQDISAIITGKMGMTLIKQGQNVFPQFGSYDLNIKFQLGEVLKQKLGGFVSILQNYLVAQNTYSIRLMGNGFIMPPQMIKGQ